VFAFAASQLTGGPSKQPTAAHAQAIVWNNRVFFSREDLAKWLHSRGASYDAWVAHHPQPTETTLSATPGPKRGAGRYLPSRHTVLVGAAAAGLVLGLALLSLLVSRLARFWRGREHPQLRLPTRRHEEPDLTPMEALARERTLERPLSYRLQRRLDVGWAVAASSVGVGVALVLPHL
jgi:hypothetical protein